MTLPSVNKLVLKEPQSFSDIVGQDLTVAALTARLQVKHKQADHLVFAGPEGAGKRSLARLYAQALVCEQPLEDGSPCQRCMECQGVERSSSFAYAEIDASRRGDDEAIRTLVERDAQLNTANVRVVVINRAERLAPEGADAALKTLERETKSVFLFLVQDLKAFAGALRSRCSVFHIGAADEATLDRHLSIICERAGCAPGPLVLQAVGRNSQGLVGRTVTTLCRVATQGDLSLAHMRAALGLDWGAELLRCWDCLLTDRYDEAIERFMSLRSGERTRIEAMQAFLVAALLYRRTEGRILGRDCAIETVSPEGWASFRRSWDEFTGAAVEGELILERMVAWWANVEPNAPQLTAFVLGYKRLKASIERSAKEQQP